MANVNTTSQTRFGAQLTSAGTRSTSIFERSASFPPPRPWKALHRAAGEVWGYAAMKAELLTNLASGGSFELPDLDLSWLEWPDIDISSLFDWFDVSQLGADWG